MAAVVKAMANKAMAAASEVYCAQLGHKLKIYGLRYEDLMVKHPVVEEAIDLQAPHVNTGRVRRIKRGSDLSYKCKNMQDYAPDAEINMWKPEIIPMVEKIEKREEEYELLNKGW
mmetsp:Transcript_980/g.1927  ORF Transcript_980/g.1927 Transcript_980/m.1927 type:complete len:115 (-) Transcript_980:132-476(-)|eukprot:CAMPEP_0113328080 /NCGR_PEP_ID=MMETSP0010_2-20120614/19769_1 /TAXON_ID=216773 ORGANISM="Corethron hystrix, Strain 308" /NCGR_SAMPLE_ID=MMETSP0010_2 /ASSEMBLY_ACC=CAM_ASM_000155 /LENGTH=114 /DNA_ID=CAMNT_0000189265 /DNA_START=67 /DNA_END=411 /DNA_ORIENTATION=+ /assembly_acc=CAM_ASM_000155